MNKTWLMLFILLIVNLPYGIVVAADNVPLSECNTLYFLNGIYIYDSHVSGVLGLETPGNILLIDGFNQTVEYMLPYNLTYSMTTNRFIFRIERNSSFQGFFISKITICSKPMNTARDILIRSYRDPRYTPTKDATIPREISEEYIRKPYEKVVEVVAPEYESWFSNIYGFNVSHASMLGIATTASYFIQRIYINYSASGIPRSMDQVIEERIGDCDDMSKIVVELLNHYGIPAVIVYGYTRIEEFKLDFSIGNVTYKFINNGPHAFVMAYIPGLGWITLDWLAASFIANPFIVEAYTRETVFEREEIEELVDLHKAINATQIIAVFSEKELILNIGEPITIEKIKRYLDNLVEETIIMDEAKITVTETITETLTIRETSTITQTLTSIETHTTVTTTIVTKIDYNVTFIGGAVTLITGLVIGYGLYRRK